MSSWTKSILKADWHCRILLLHIYPTRYFLILRSLWVCKIIFILITVTGNLSLRIMLFLLMLLWQIVNIFIWQIVDDKCFIFTIDRLENNADSPITI